MFLDGRPFKTVYGKDFVDALITNTNQLMAGLEKPEADRLVSHQNTAASLQGQIQLIRSHQAVQDRRINYALAQEAEEDVFIVLSDDIFRKRLLKSKGRSAPL